LKINNKNNILPIVLYNLWVLYVLYFYFFKQEIFNSHAPCGAGYMMVGLMFFTPILSLLFLLILAIINLISKKKYFTDYEYISLPFLLLIGIMLFKMFI
jgi:hypothetical protein